MRIFLFIFMFLVATSQDINGQVYNGSTPVTNEVREFPGISLSDSIDFVRWDLSLGEKDFQLSCNYGLAKPGTSGFRKDNLKQVSGDC